jgi:hypothetical protein
VEIVLHLAEPFSKLEDGQYARQDTALIARQITAPVVLSGNGTGDVVGYGPGRMPPRRSFASRSRSSPIA